MKYIKVTWIHDLPHEPIVLYSELNDARWETRKVEVFADERKGFADQVQSSPGTALGEEPIPELSEISTDPQFQPVEISSEEFDSIWKAAINGS